MSVFVAGVLLKKKKNMNNQTLDYEKIGACLLEYTLVKNWFAEKQLVVLLL